MKLLPLRLTWDQEFNFWSKVNRTQDDVCWNWCGSKANGRPDFKLNGINFYAARIAYFLKHKVDPKSEKVLHTCDNELCVNWNHLYLGDHSRNMRDRFKEGTADGSAKLCVASVRVIRDLGAKGELTHIEIARLFGVNRTLVTRVINHDIWKDVQ